MLNPKPSTITVENHGATTRFTRRWYAPKAWLILVFAAFWNLFLLFWYQKALEASPQDSFILLFPLIHVGIGMGLIYSAATMFLNKSIVELVPGKLTVRHFPYPGGAIWRSRRDRSNNYTAKRRQLPGSGELPSSICSRQS